MAGAEHPGRDATLHQWRQLEQSQGVGDLRPRAPDPARQLLVRAAEVVEELLVGGGLLQRVELRPVEVLQERVPQHVLVVGAPDDGRDGGLPRLPGGPQPALPHDQLVGGCVARRRALRRRDLPHHHGLEDPQLADAGHQLGQLVLVEDLAGLARVGTYRIDGYLGEGGPGDRCQLVRRRGDLAVPRIVADARIVTGAGSTVSRETRCAGVLVRGPRGCGSDVASGG